MDVPNWLRWFKVFQNTASDLLATVTPANLRGIIPNPHNAERINKYNSAFGVDDNLIYTVLTGDILFISSVWMSGRESADADARGYLRVYDGGDNLVLILNDMLFDKAGQLIFTQQYRPALEFPADYYIKIQSNHANLDVYGGLSGWIEDV